MPVEITEEPEATQPPPIGGAVVQPKKKKRVFTMGAPPPEPVKTDEVGEPLFPNKRPRNQNEPIHEWLKALGTGLSFKIYVHRTRPTQHMGRKVDGYLGVYTDFITDDDLQATYGGGSFQLKVQVPNPKGSWVFLTSTTVEIAGDPRIDNLPTTQAPQPTPVAAQGALDNPMVNQAWQEMKASKDRAEQEAREASRNAGGNLQFQIQAAIDPLKTMLADKDKQIERLLNKLDEATKPKESIQDDFVKAMLFKGDVRLTDQKTQFDSELRQLKQSHVDDLKRLEDRFARDLDSERRTHDRAYADMKSSFERELSNMKAAHEREMSNMKSAHEHAKISTDASISVQKTVLERDNARLEADVRELRVEVKDLRAKKDLSLKEKVDEMNSIKDLFGGDEEKEKGALEKVVEVVVNSEKAMDTVTRLMGNNNAQPQTQTVAATVQQAPAKKKSNMIVRKSDGQVFKRTENGLVPVKQKNADGSEEPLIKLNDTDVMMAVKFVEAGFRNNVDPVNFATTSRTSIPEPVMLAIQREGVDGFLTKVVQLDQSSPLNTQAGRNWIRKVAKALLGEDAT